MIGGPGGHLTVLGVLQRLLRLHGQGLAITLVELGPQGLAQGATGEGAGQHGGGTAAATTDLAADEDAGRRTDHGADIFLIEPFVLRHVGAASDGEAATQAENGKAMTRLHGESFPKQEFRRREW